MFRRARIRLTVLYIGLFALVLGVFSLAFYLSFATVLAPTFDVAPELSNDEAARAAYQATVERIGLALLLGNVVIIALVGLVAWALAARTLRPIREAHARQRRFVADASHEMRSPLAAIRSSAEGALIDADDTAGQRRALTVVVDSAERLTRITNDLLLLARSDELPSDRSVPIDLSVAVAESVEAFGLAHPALPRARLTLGADLRVTADDAELGRIVINLLDNAIRYGTADREPVHITTRASDQNAVVEVADTGPGIAAAELERVFEPFYRVHAAQGVPDGHGLGLAIARSLAVRNGGRLTVSSQPGLGTTFRLSFPRFR